MKNYYEILEVNPKASNEVIKKAHQVLIKKYHPDLYTGEKKIQAEKKLKDINEAYKILSDNFLREQYDTELEKENSYKYSNNMQYMNNQENSRYQKKSRNNKRTIEENYYEQEQQPEERKNNVGTFAGLVDLTKALFSNMPKREKGKKEIKKEDLIAAGLTAIIILALGVILWFIPATNGFIRSLWPF